MNELISIIVPIYNVEKYLNKCITSIVSQKYSNLEIILVDDGSTDECANICEDWKKRDKRIKVIHKINGGLSDARNFGIKEAKGEYIGFIDSDDYIDNDMYTVLYDNAKKYNADIVICGRYIEYENGKTEYKQKENINIVMNHNEALINLNSFVGFDMSACDKLYKTELFKNIKFPFGLKCEDYYTMYKLFDISNIVVFNSEPYYHYFQREGSISRNKIMDESFIEASISQIEYFKSNCPDLLFSAYTAYAFANIAMYNKIIHYKIDCDRLYKAKLQKRVNDNLKYILKNKHLSNFKKLQAVVFAKSIILYKFIKRL